MLEVRGQMWAARKAKSSLTEIFSDSTKVRHLKRAFSAICTYMSLLVVTCRYLSICMQY